MATLEGAIAAIQDIVGAISGVVEAPDYPPESVNQFPIALCYPLRFDAQGAGGGLVKGLHTVRIDLLCARQLLPKDIAKAAPYGRLIYRALWNNPNLSNAVDTINAVRGEFGPIYWGGSRPPSPPTGLGWSIEVDFKIQEATA